MQALLCSLVLILGPARHDGLHERIARLDARLAEAGPSVDLYVERAELQRFHGAFDAALADLEQAVALEPQHVGAALSRAHVYAAQGRAEAARTSLGPVLRARPGDPDALLLAARVLAQVGELDAALARYDEAIVHLEAPRPVHFLARADVLQRIDATRRLGPQQAPQRALAALDAGIERLGAVPALVLAAIELELERAQHDAALARLDTLIAHATRREHWLARRAEILDRAGRADQALDAWLAARSAMERLPARHRRSADSARLAARIEARLATSHTP